MDLLDADAKERRDKYLEGMKESFDTLLIYVSTAGLSSYWQSEHRFTGCPVLGGLQWFLGHHNIEYHCTSECTG